MDSIFEKIKVLVRKASTDFSTLQMQIDSSILNESFCFSTTLNKQKFHSASVGKMMTMVLVVQAIEKGLIDWTSPICRFLDAKLLEGLFIFEEKDYAKQVTVSHLLSHTSGINDYFDGESTMDPPFIDQLIADQDKFYTPLDLLTITKTYQKAISAPDDAFLYSDTGYVLLGLLVETLYHKSFFEILNEQIFRPLRMFDTTFAFYDPKFRQEDLGPVIIEGTDIRKFRSLSADFSGGGLSTTAPDLTLFLKAMHKNQLITAESLQKIAQFENHFEAGMYYGFGLMELRFEKFFFLLRGLPHLYGHLGILGVHAWWNPLTGDTFVINVGNRDQIIPSFKLLIQVVTLIEKARKSAHKTAKNR
jgi:D-alanyl-D-alanine carboxypeptidase